MGGASATRVTDWGSRNMSNSFIFYRSFAEALEGLPAEDFKRCVNALCEYALDGKEPELDNAIVKMFFTLVRPQIDANSKRREAGRSGGLAKASKSVATLKQNVPNANANENVNANAKEKTLREPKGSLSQSDQKIARGKEPEAAVEAIPLTDGTEWRPTISEYDEYCRLFPAVDVASALRGMRAWSIGNPNKRKTRMGVKRFVNSWLSREQDNSGKTTRNGGSAYIDAIKNRMDVVDRWAERTGGNDEAGIYNAREGDEGSIFGPEVFTG